MILESLPETVLLNVFSSLSAKNLCQVAQVSTRWKTLSELSELWRLLKIRRYGVEALAEASKAQTQSFKQDYQRLWEMQKKANKILENNLLQNPHPSPEIVNVGLRLASDLSLFPSSLTGDDLLEISKVLPNLRSLLFHSVKNNTKFSNLKCLDLVSLSRSCPHLNELKMSDSFTITSEEFASFLKSSSIRRVAIFSSALITDDVVETACASTKLKSLKLVAEQNQLTERGLSAIKENGTRLHTLQIDSAILGVQTAVLSGFLPHAPTMRELSFLAKEVDKGALIRIIELYPRLQRFAFKCDGKEMKTTISILLKGLPDIRKVEITSAKKIGKIKKIFLRKQIEKSMGHNFHTLIVNGKIVFEAKSK